MSNFDTHKANCLSKLDKSAAGRIDAKAVEICQVINELDDFYTTSSCAGRTLIWRGSGNKGKQGKTFERFRVNHDLIDDISEYLDPIIEDNYNEQHHEIDEVGSDFVSPFNGPNQAEIETDGTLWLRCEPFILHICCRTLHAAEILIAAARSAFKNVGLQSWRDQKYMVCIWGDDGLDMPITVPGTNGSESLYPLISQKNWIKTIVNEKHCRNWEKINKLVSAVREIENKKYEDFGKDVLLKSNDSVHRPRHFDIIGDIALLHEFPKHCTTDEEIQKVGEEVIKTNPKKIKVCAVQCGKLEGEEKKGKIRIIAGRRRAPLMTTHWEFGVGCVINIGEVFFTPRMGLERLRLCNSVGRGEEVCCLFSGCAAEVLQIAVKTEATKVIAIELNPEAAECAKKGVELLRGKHKSKNEAAAAKIELICGDVVEILPKFPPACFDRIIVPRPKGVEAGINGGGDGGLRYLELLLPLLKSGAECHWYDFAGKHELPGCERTRTFISEVCTQHELRCEFLYVGLAGKKSIAAGQYRICIDFRIHAQSEAAKELHGNNIVNQRMLSSTSKLQEQVASVDPLRVKTIGPDTKAGEINSNDNNLYRQQVLPKEDNV